ncbi:MAG: hypothetical protein EB116_11555 [Betaproteobacteria bacterium]|nr:hypothetical protein [Betaproteobacteria bacterium]
MKLGDAIVYVNDMVASVSCFEQVFGLKRRFVHESGYAALDVGEKALAFASVVALQNAVKTKASSRRVRQSHKHSC